MTTPRDAAFRVAVLDVLAKRVSAALTEARKEAEPVFAAARVEGNKQIEVALPSGTQVGTVSIKASDDTVNVNEADVLAWVLDNAPGEVEPVISSSALDQPDVVAYIRRFYPELASKRVRPAYRSKLLGQLNDDGELVDEATGEVVKLADTVKSGPSGAFVLTFEKAKNGKPAGRDRIAEAWQSGEVDIRDLILPALEAGEQ
ncbi:hypothetical protein ACBJ59_36290 [Nonomuraea sp. MTCD27]|uniref:hypothetical protein n=1 Tax=Nonomuraea sp. MTCD27 TaxID=1676747 RepID=UPI0035BF815D